MSLFFLDFTVSLSFFTSSCCRSSRSRYWYWPGWKGGNTKNRVGEGDKMLILGVEVGEGGELCPFHEVGKVTSHLL